MRRVHQVVFIALWLNCAFHTEAHATARPDLPGDYLVSLGTAASGFLKHHLLLSSDTTYAEVLLFRMDTPTEGHPKDVCEVLERFAAPWERNGSRSSHSIHYAFIELGQGCRGKSTRFLGDVILSDQGGVSDASLHEFRKEAAFYGLSGDGTPDALHQLFTAEVLAPRRVPLTRTEFEGAYSNYCGMHFWDDPISQLFCRASINLRRTFFKIRLWLLKNKKLR